MLPHFGAQHWGAASPAAIPQPHTSCPMAGGELSVAAWGGVQLEGGGHHQAVSAPPGHKPRVSAPSCLHGGWGQGWHPAGVLLNPSLCQGLGAMPVWGSGGDVGQQGVWDGVSHGCPSALTHGCTLSAAASPPLAPAHCSTWSRTKNAGTSPARGARCQPRGRRHPVLPAAASGGAWAAPKGTGILRGVWAPHAPWALAQRGVQEGADTSTRAGSPAPSLPSAGAGTHQNIETGRRKTSPEGGWCHRKPQPSGAEDRRRRFLPASALHALVHPLHGTSQHTALVHLCTCSLHAQTPARTPGRVLVSMHARPAAAPPGLAGHWLTPLTHIPSRAHAPPRFPAGPCSPPGHSSCLW